MTTRFMRKMNRERIREQKLSLLIEALEFYAQTRRYKGPNQLLGENEADKYTPADLPYLLDVTRDEGAIARDALVAIKEVK